MKLHHLTIAAILSLAFTTHSTFASPGEQHDASVGKPGKAAAVTRTINVDMTDNMRFTPANITVKQGETIRFVVNNKGVLKHEFVLGTNAELKEHYRMMMKHPDMAHSEANMITLDGGKTGDVIWQFTQAGKVEFGCLQPGHFDVGMKGEVVVNKSAP